jgi:1-acyl-sn-glycerol-3-phosphate acyltransferase
MASAPYELASLTSFKLWRRYFRFEIDGFDVLRETESSLIVAYHGGPWTFDLWMLGDRMHDELGYFPRAVWHWLWWTIPGLREAVTELGGLRAAPTEEEMVELKARGEHLIVAPGGMREAMRPFWRHGSVDLGDRRGYVRLALRHELPIIPVASSGIDATFLGCNDGYALSRRLFGRGDLPAWLALGAGGIWPLALPFPVKIRQRIGAPIRLGPLPPDAAAAEDAVEAAHERVTTTLQAMLDGFDDDG